MSKENIYKIRNIAAVAALFLADTACQIQGPNNTNVYVDTHSGRSKNGIWTETHLQVNKDIYLLNTELAPGSDCTSGLLEQGTDMGGAAAFDSSKTKQVGKLC